MAETSAMSLLDWKRRYEERWVSLRQSRSDSEMAVVSG